MRSFCFRSGVGEGGRTARLGLGALNLPDSIAEQNKKNEKVKKIIKKLSALIAGTPCRTPSEKRGKLATGAGKRAVLNENISSFSAYLT